MGHKNPPPNERVVYLALKNLFKGKNAEVRNNKAIRRIIKQYEKQESVADLVREHDVEVICNSARSLLCDEIFASTLKAKIRFPELFELSNAKSAERHVSEPEATRHEADAIEHALQGHWDDLEATDPWGNALDTVKGNDTECDHPLPSAKAQVPSFSNGIIKAPLSSHILDSIPSLFPIYLPFKAQHSLLVHLQHLLEFSCYNFGLRVIPATLRQRGWVCAESVELNRWTDEFLKTQNIFSDTKNDTKILTELCRSIANIRHAAVHRIAVNAKGMEQFLLDAEALATLLNDAECTDKIANLRRETLATMEELQRNKQILHSKLNETLHEIATRRQELDRLEATAIAEMGIEDQEYQNLAGKCVDKTMALSKGPFSTALDTEKEVEIKADNSDEDQPQDFWDAYLGDTG